MATTQSGAINPFEITRPHPRLMTYYVLAALLTGPLMPIAIIPLWFRYITIRYHFDDAGLSMSWGILFKREVHLTYRRIQDIHLTRGLLQRWMGLATVAIQTASGSSTPEMSIEGILEAEALRDFLYQRMRGAKDERAQPREAAQGEATNLESEALALLREIRDLLKSRTADEGRTP